MSVWILERPAESCATDRRRLLTQYQNERNRLPNNLGNSESCWNVCEIEDGPRELEPELEAFEG